MSSTIGNHLCVDTTYIPYQNNDKKSVIAPKKIDISTKIEGSRRNRVCVLQQQQQVILISKFSPRLDLEMYISSCYWVVFSGGLYQVSTWREVV